MAWARKYPPPRLGSILNICSASLLLGVKGRILSAFCVLPCLALIQPYGINSEVSRETSRHSRQDISKFGHMICDPGTSRQRRMREMVLSSPAAVKMIAHEVAEAPNSAMTFTSAHLYHKSQPFTLPNL